MHILSLVTDNNLSGISGKEENGRRNYFIIKLFESMGQGRDQTPEPQSLSFSEEPVSLVQIRKYFEYKTTIIFLSISLNICSGCSKEPSQ